MFACASPPEPPQDVFSSKILSLLKNTCVVIGQGQCLEGQTLIPSAMIPALLRLCLASRSPTPKIIKSFVDRRTDRETVPDGYCTLDLFLRSVEHFGEWEFEEVQKEVLERWLVGVAKKLHSAGHQLSGRETERVRHRGEVDLSRSRSPTLSDSASSSTFHRSDSAVSQSFGSDGTSLASSQCQLQALQIKLLQKLVKELQDESLKKDQKLKQMSQRLKREEVRNTSLEEQLDEAKAKRLKKFAIERHADRKQTRAGGLVVEGESSGWLTAEGCLSAAIRRNLSNIGTADLGPTLLMELSRWTVARAEVKAGACLLASSRLFWESWAASIRDAESDTRSLTVISYRQDATNGSCWQKSKLTALEMEGAFVAGVSGDDLHVAPDSELCDSVFDDKPLPIFGRIKRLADVLPVEDSSGKGTLGMTEKMMASLACPTWRDLLGVLDSNVGSSCAFGGPKHLSNIHLAPLS